MAVAEKSLTVRMTEITKKKTIDYDVNFVFMVCGLRSSINSIKNVDRLQITKQALQVSVNRN